MSAAGVPVATSALPFDLRVRGKVRDVYDVGDDRLLIVATDRISAFDVVMREPIPGKGVVLTQITAWWLARLGDLTPHHLISADPTVIRREVPALAGTAEDVWPNRSMLVRRTEPLPIECVVRGYLSGSAWAEYRRSGTLAGDAMPTGLVESERLDPPLFSPATKAAAGHDENLPFGVVRDRLGEGLADLLRQRSFALYQRGRTIAAAVGIIIADTKFEFGRLQDGRVLLIDEVLTPDSSRFWPAESYVPGRGQPSLDKQPVRDFLEALVRAGDWNREPPAPALPPDVVESTSRRYGEVFHRLTGFWPKDFPVHAAATPPPVEAR